MTVYLDIKCSDCKEVIPGDQILKHRREVHGFKKDLIKIDKTLTGKHKRSVAKQSLPKLAEKEEKEDMWRKIIFSGFESNRRKH
ncbi:MAG TPA: hypothetical protein VIL74_03525 [Pyrinomonadaceae bacterium]|jgi:hypothetical protein